MFSFEQLIPYIYTQNNNKKQLRCIGACTVLEIKCERLIAFIFSFYNQIDTNSNFCRLWRSKSEFETDFYVYLSFLR